MRIAEEIDHVMNEFVSAQDVFNALTAEQGLEPYQIASWMLRNLDALERVTLVECNRSIEDFRMLEKSWISDVLYDLARGDDTDWGESETGRGFVGGWLESDIRRFFQATRVDFPESAIMKHGAPAGSPDLQHERIPAAVDAAAQRESADERAMGTKERTTLLTIIAALAAESDIQIVSPSKSAEIIAAITERMGAPVAKRTIEEHLKKVPDALERRAR